VEHKDDIDWIKCYTAIELQGTKPKGRRKKTWWDAIKEDITRFVCPKRMDCLGGN